MQHRNRRRTGRLRGQTTVTGPILANAQPPHIQCIESDACLSGLMDQGVPVFQLVGRPGESGAEQEHRLLKWQRAELPDQALQRVDLTQRRVHLEPHVTARAQRVAGAGAVGILRPAAGRRNVARRLHAQAIQHGRRAQIDRRKLVDGGEFHGLEQALTIVRKRIDRPQSAGVQAEHANEGVGAQFLVDKFARRFKRESPRLRIQIV